MVRRIAVAAVATVSLAAAACGTDDPTGVSTIAPADAKAGVERAAGVRLVAEPVPADARAEGLRFSFSNTKSAVKDKQAIALFVMENEDVADEVSDEVRDTAPKSAKLIVNGTVMVVYADAGSNKAKAVERAVKAL